MQKLGELLKNNKEILKDSRQMRSLILEFFLDNKTVAAQMYSACECGIVAKMIEMRTLTSGKSAV